MPGSFVLDSSTLLATLLPDEHSQQADRLIASLVPGQAVAPQHWPLEVTNALLMAVRRSRISEEQRRGALEDAVSLPVSIMTEVSAATWLAISDLADKHRLTAYDAAYLELASTLSFPFATLDRRLAQAAQREGVNLLLT